MNRFSDGSNDKRGYVLKQKEPSRRRQLKISAFLGMLFLSTSISCTTERQECLDHADAVNEIDYCPLYLILGSHGSNNQDYLNLQNSVLVICARDKIARENCNHKSELPAL